LAGSNNSVRIVLDCQDHSDESAVYAGPGRRAAAKLLTKAAAAHRMASFVKQPSSSGFEDCDSGTTQE